MSHRGLRACVGEARRAPGGPNEAEPFIRAWMSEDVDKGMLLIGTRRVPKIKYLWAL